jgi:CubicO group peptidase (beta-lactamase class C family)
VRALLASLLLAASCVSAPPVQDEDQARAADAMESLAAQGFAGSVLAACGDEVMFAADYGLADPRGREPSYWLASISKQFTAAAVLRLAEARRLDLDDPLSRFFPDAPADKAGITLRQLLTHQSGLSQAYAADGVAERDAAARAILAAPLGSAPGAFRYSNDNYTLLAIVIEIASGQAFEDFVRENVFAPAGLRHAGFWPDRGEDFTPPLLREMTGPAAHASWGFRGGVGMRASVRDLYAWTRALDGGRVLSAESTALLYGPHTAARDGDGVGFGWFWSDLPDGRWLWTRGAEDFGPNVILYRRAGTALVIIAATNAGPAESAGPGWSRRARDALMRIYGAGPCPED